MERPYGYTIEIAGVEPPVEAIETSEGFALWCVACSSLLGRFGNNARPDLVEDTAYFHVVGHDKNHYAEQQQIPSPLWEKDWVESEEQHLERPRDESGNIYSSE